MVNNDQHSNLGFQEALKILEQNTTEKFLSKIWVPSLQKEIEVKEINAKQQKKLLNSALEDTAIKNSFIVTFYEILSENVSDKNILSSLTIIDKIFLALGMRAQISNELKVVLQEDPLIEETIDLKDLLSKLKEFKYPFESEINLSNLKIITQIPTIKEEVDFEKISFKSKSEDQIQFIKSTIVEAFLLETAKYIFSIEIENKSLNYVALTPSQKIHIVENLPAKAIQGILQNVSQWKGNLEKLLSITNKQHNITKPLVIDSTIFINL
jgi:hypothetical protein